MKSPRPGDPGRKPYTVWSGPLLNYASSWRNKAILQRNAFAANRLKDLKDRGRRECTRNFSSMNRKSKYRRYYLFSYNKGPHT